MPIIATNGRFISANLVRSFVSCKNCMDLLKFKGAWIIKTSKYQIFEKFDLEIRYSTGLLSTKVFRNADGKSRLNAA